MTTAERNRLKAINEELVETLEGVLMLCGSTGNSLRDFEEQGEMFYQETGKMRPGKDVPSSAPWKEASPQDYRDWVEQRLQKARDILSGIKGET